MPSSLDIQLRRGNGLNGTCAGCAVLASVRPWVIVLTNYNSPEYRLHAMTAGTDYFFDKATEFHRVGEVLNSLARPATVN